MPQLFENEADYQRRVTNRLLVVLVVLAALDIGLGILIRVTAEELHRELQKHFLDPVLRRLVEIMTRHGLLPWTRGEMDNEQRDRLIEACGGDGRFIGLALAELGATYVEDFDDAEFLIARVRALREEEIGDAG